MKRKTKIYIGVAGAFLAAICVLTPLIIMYLGAHTEEIKESAQTYYTTASTPSAYSNMSLSDLGTVIGVLCGFAGVLYYLIRN